jgi:hypothetical protein
VRDRTFETCATAAMRVRLESSDSKAARSISPASEIGATRSLAFRSSHSICHGTMLAWCSMAVSSTSSPGPTCWWPQLAATRLIASVALRTNTISRASRAPRKPRSVSRAPS